MNGNIRICRTESSPREMDRERLIQELNEALARVKTLSGLLHICANCRRILDERSHWQRVEEFFEEHLNVVFSHRLCPDCVPKYFLEISGSRIPE